MRAFNSQFRLVETSIPIPRDNEALVRVHSFGVTYSDLRLRDVIPTKQLGIEFSGRIESFGGTDRASFYLGQSVYGLAIEGGAFAEFVVCPLDTLCPTPHGMSLTAAASIADMWFSALQLIKVDAEMKKRDKIVVFNAMSHVGQCVVELSQILGCRRVTAVVKSDKARRDVENYLTFRTALPDEVVALVDTPDVEEQLAEYDNTVAAVIDLRPRPDLSQDIRVVQEDGRIAITNPAPALTRTDLTSIVYKRLRLHGATFRARQPSFYKAHRDFLVEHINPKFVNGQLNPRLAEVYDWKDIEKAFDFIASECESPGKVICNIVPELYAGEGLLVQIEPVGTNDRG